MTLKNALKFILISSCVATTFQVLMIFFFAVLFDTAGAIYMRELYVLPLIGLLSALPILIFVRKESAPRWEWMLRRVLHLPLTATLVFLPLMHLAWVDQEYLWWGFLFFLVMYIISSIITGVRAKKLANQINARIRASHDSENASH